jgi:hypothetical protein
MLLAKPIKEDINPRNENNQYFFQEKIYDIQEDINFIYDTFFRSLVEDIKNNSEIVKENYYVNPDTYIEDAKDWRVLTDKRDVLFGCIMTSQLTTPLCVQANNKLSVPIFCGSFDGGSYHFFPRGEKIPPYIKLSVHSTIFNMLVYRGVQALDQIPFKVRRRAKNEVNEFRIKATIAHELTHWIDNAEYNIFELIMSGAKTTAEKEEKLLLDKKNVNMTYFEIQAQVHAIKQMKDGEDTWDDYTLNDLFEYLPSLHTIAISLYEKYGKDVLKIWIKYFLKRLAREGLAGKNMSKFSLDLLEKDNTLRSGTIY